MVDGFEYTRSKDHLKSETIGLRNLDLDSRIRPWTKVKAAFRDITPFPPVYGYAKHVDITRRCVIRSSACRVSTVCR